MKLFDRILAWLGMASTVAVAVVATALAAPAARAAATDLATAPLETSTATLVKPNIFYVLDD